MAKIDDVLARQKKRKRDAEFRDDVTPDIAQILLKLGGEAAGGISAWELKEAIQQGRFGQHGKTKESQAGHRKLREFATNKYRIPTYLAKAAKWGPLALYGAYGLDTLENLMTDDDTDLDASYKGKSNRGPLSTVNKKKKLGKGSSASSGGK